jgi:hypothetical protein
MGKQFQPRIGRSMVRQGLTISFQPSSTDAKVGVLLVYSNGWQNGKKVVERNVMAVPIVTSEVDEPIVGFSQWIDWVIDQIVENVRAQLMITEVDTLSAAYAYAEDETEKRSHRSS